MIDEIREHYDLLIDEGNDPVLDPPELKEYMNGWDGDLFIDLMELAKNKTVLEIGCGTGRIAVKVAPKVRAFCKNPFAVRKRRVNRRRFFRNVNRKDL